MSEHRSLEKERSPEAPRKTPTRRRPFSAGSYLLVLGLAAPLLLYLLVFATAQSVSIPLPLSRSTSILWVTAHPDDESLFFSPTMLNLLSRGATGHLLCLSTGDHEGLGEVRLEELRRACAALGIAAASCVALEHPQLRDNPDIWWPESVVEDVVRSFVAKWDVDLVITFDAYGVSGHSNHRAVSSALSRAALSSTAFPPTYKLLSTNVVAKFSSLLSLPFTLLSRQLEVYLHPSRASPLLIFSSLASYRKARVAFAQHASQRRWYRTLFTLFSRYLWYVELEEVRGM